MQCLQPTMMPKTASLTMLAVREQWRYAAAGGSRNFQIMQEAERRAEHDYVTPKESGKVVATANGSMGT